MAHLSDQPLPCPTSRALRRCAAELCANASGFSLAPLSLSGLTPHRFQGRLALWAHRLGVEIGGEAACAARFVWLIVFRFKLFGRAGMSPGAAQLATVWWLSNLERLNAKLMKEDEGKELWVASTPNSFSVITGWGKYNPVEGSLQVCGSSGHVLSFLLPCRHKRRVGYVTSLTLHPHRHCFPTKPIPYALC
jgi:hypothetical protein